MEGWDGVCKLFGGAALFVSLTNIATYGPSLLIMRARRPFACNLLSLSVLSAPYCDWRRVFVEGWQGVCKVCEGAVLFVDCTNMATYGPSLLIMRARRPFACNLL